MLTQDKPKKQIIEQIGEKIKNIFNSEPIEIPTKIENKPIPKKRGRKKKTEL